MVRAAHNRLLCCARADEGGTQTSAARPCRAGQLARRSHSRRGHGSECLALRSTYRGSAVLDDGTHDLCDLRRLELADAPSRPFRRGGSHAERRRRDNKCRVVTHRGPSPLRLPSARNLVYLSSLRDAAGLFPETCCGVMRVAAERCPRRRARTFAMPYLAEDEVDQGS